MSRRKQHKPRAMRESDDDQPPPPLPAQLTKTTDPLTKNDDLSPEKTELSPEKAELSPSIPERSLEDVRNEERSKLALDELKLELRKSRELRSKEEKSTEKPPRRTRSSSKKEEERKEPEEENPLEPDDQHPVKDSESDVAESLQGMKEMNLDESRLDDITTSPPKTIEQNMTILDTKTCTAPKSSEISATAAEDAVTALNDSDMSRLEGDSDSHLSDAASLEKTANSGSYTSMMDEPRKKHEYAKILPVSLDSGDHAYICPICSDTLEDSHSLTVHIRNHNSKVPSLHSCTICGKTLCSQSSLDRHMLVHSGERPFRCQVCDLSFTTNGNMHRHMRVHEKEFSKSPGSLKILLDASLQPVHGGNDRRVRKRRSAGGLSTMVDTFMDKRMKTSTSSTAALAENVMSVTDALKKKLMTPSESGIFRDESKPESEGEKLHCPVCEKTFLCKNGLESHIESSHPGCNMKCQLCNLAFPSISLLTAHHAVIHASGAFVNGIAAPPLGFHELTFADFSATKFPLIAKRWCEKNARRPSSAFHNFECLICKKAFPSSESLDLHVKTHANPDSACDVCQLIMPDQESLRKHKQTAHVSRALNFDESRQQDNNKERFLGILKLQQDREAEIESDMSDEESSPRNNDYFKNIAEMNKLSAAERAKRLEENNNSSDFADIQKIIQNANCSALPPLSSTPTTAPKFSDLFKKASAAAEDSEDEGVPVGYDYDDFSDSMSDSSEPAMNNNGTTPSKFQCKFCEATFENFNSLKVHMRTHQGLSPFKCNMCPYASPDKTTLIRHLRTHNGERPFQCKLCLYAFTTKANCERHVRKKHQKEGKEEIDSVVGYNDQLEETSVDDFQNTLCKYCGQDFKFYRALKHHLRSHSSCRLKPFACAICDIGFSTKANSIRHIQKRHLEIEPSQWEANVKYNARAESTESTPRGSPVSFPPQQQQTYGAPSAHGPRQNREESALLRLAKFSTPGKMENPLDFRKKALLESPSAILNAVNKETENVNEVLDLSRPSQEKVSKPASILPSKPSIHPAFNILPFMNPALNASDMILKQQNLGQPSARVFKCPYCHLQFNQESKLHLHMKMHATSRPFQCNYCPAGFTVKSNLEIHVRTRHDNGGNQSGYSTPARNRFVSPSLKMLHHSPNKPRPSPYSFLYPNAKYPTLANSIAENNRDSELASVSKLLDAAKQDQFKSLMNAHKVTSMTDAAAESEEDKELVVMGDGNMVEIKKEGNSFRHEDYSSGGDASSPDKTPRKKRNSYANAPNRVSCPYCTRTFPWISSLRRHILTHTGQKPYKCPDCPVHFSTKSNRERHLLRKHGINPANPNTRQIMDRPYKCQLCVFSSFSKPEKLVHHYKTKHPEADIPTDIHEMNVEVWLTSPNREVMLEEGEDGPLVINEDDWSDDEEEDSTPEKYSPAPSCDEDAILIKDEISEDEEDEIMQTSLGTEERVTPEAANRRLMMSEQYSPSVSPIARPSPGRTTVINPERDNYNVDKILDCWQCGQHYATRKLLLRHLKEHNTDLPFKCYLCDASYLTRKQCLDHKADCHPDDWVMLRARNKVENIEEFVITMERLTEVADEEGANNARIKEVRIGNTDEMTIMAAERKVFCALCPKKFWSLQDLRRHMRSHTGEKPFECDICGRYFTLKHSMMRHRRKHTEADYKPYKAPRPSFVNDVSHLGHESNDEDLSVRSSRGTPVPDHDQFLAIRERMSHNVSPVTMTPLPPPVAMTTPAPSVAKETNNPPSVDNKSSLSPMSSLLSLAGDSSDILHNLLGVDNSAIEQMLTTGSADAAAKLLGMD